MQLFAKQVPFGSILLLCVARAVAAEEPLFPFVISYDSPNNAANVSAWLDAPAGKHGFVRSEDGRLATDAGPIRFWATNLCFDACFPTRDQAQKLAARLARFGINCVRMHHMDNRSIWGKSPNKTIIDPEMLGRLDYLIYQLKLRGIYTNINLHVSRTLGPAEGFPSPQGRPNYDKGLDNFEPRMIQLQKKYARDLLTHVNPHTNTAYTQEPAVAFVEINNENGLMHQWNGGGLDELPEPYSGTFRSLWNAWLAKKYGSTDKLRAAWKAGERPLGEELLPPGKTAGQTAWRMERDTQTDAELSVTPAGPDREEALSLLVKRPGSVAWHPQLTRGEFSLKKDMPYTLVLRARADRAQRISVNCMMNHEPWSRLGLSSDVQVGPEWQEFRQMFLASDDDAKARLSINGFQPGSYELAGISLRPGGIVGLARGERIEDASVPVLRHGSLNMTEAARHDFLDFLWETERDYWWGMYRFLKDELKVEPLVAGTQPTYSTPHLQAALDYVDAHSYWHHPSFPGRPWDSRNWYVRNEALVNRPGDGTFPGLAARRVSGKAFTVSEYNHPAPNFYAAEGFPLIAAYGAFQGWDGVFSFTWSHSTEFDLSAIKSYFDIKGDTQKLAHQPACAALFLRGDAAPARQTVLVPLGLEAERQRLREKLDPRTLTATQLGLDPRLALVHAVALDLGVSQPSGTDRRSLLAPRQVGNLPRAAELVSDTGQLRWNTSQKGAGYAIVDTPRTKVFTGFVRGRTFRLGEIGLAIGKTRLDWATISLVALDGDGFGSPGRILIAATGWVQNQGGELQELGDNRITLSNQWGEGPVLCEGVPASITFPVPAGRISLHALDASGNRRSAVPIAQRQGQTVLELGPRHRTVWYEAEVRD